MQGNQGQGDQNLKLYIAYNDYLSAEQLSVILSILDKLYNYLYIGYNNELSIPLPPEVRMRIKECHTGQSIEVWIAEGIRQIWDGVGLHILAPVGMVGAMARIIIGFAKPVAETYKIWAEARGTRVKADAEAEKLLAEAHEIRVKADAEAEKLLAEAHEIRVKAGATDEHLNRETQKESEKRDDATILDLSKIPGEERQHASEAVFELFNFIEYAAPNISEARINDEVIYKRPENQYLQGEIYIQ